MEKRVRHVPYQGETLTLREVFFRCQDRGFVVCEVYKRDLLAWLFDTKVTEGTFFYDNQIAALEQLQGVKGVPKLVQKVEVEEHIKAIIVERTEQESLTNISSNTSRSPCIDHDLLTLGSCCLEIISKLHELHKVANFINPDHIFCNPDGSFVCTNFTLCFDREQVQIKQSELLKSSLFTNNKAQLQIRSYTQNLSQEDDFYNLGLLLYQMSYGNIDYKLEEGSGKLVVPSRPKRCFAIINTIEKCLTNDPKSYLKAEVLLQGFENQLTYSQYPAAVESSDSKSLQIMANITLSELASSKLAPSLKLKEAPKLGLFSSLGQMITKATTDTEGWFLGFVDLSATSPNKDFLNKILEKAWRKREKIRKLYEIIDKYLDETSMMQNSLVAAKVLIFMHLLMIKGPPETMSLQSPPARKKAGAGDIEKSPKACSFAHYLILRVKEVWQAIAKGDLTDKQDTFRTQGFSYLIYFYSVVLVEKCKFGLDYLNVFSGNFSVEPLHCSQDVKTIFSCKTYADLENYTSGFLLFYNLLSDDIDVPGIQFSILEAVNSEIHNCISVYCHFVGVYKRVAGCFDPKHLNVVNQMSETFETSLDHSIYRFHFLQEKIKTVPHFKIFSELFPFVSTVAVNELKQIETSTGVITEFDLNEYLAPNATIGTFVVPMPYGTSSARKQLSEQEKILFIRREIEKDIKSKLSKTIRKAASSPEQENPYRNGYPGLMVSEDPTRTQSPEGHGGQDFGNGRFSVFTQGGNYYYNLDDDAQGIQRASRSISPSPSPQANDASNKLVAPAELRQRNFKLDESFKSLGKEFDAMDKPLLDREDRKLRQISSQYDIANLEARLKEGDPVILEFLKKHGAAAQNGNQVQTVPKPLKFPSGGAAFQKKREVGVQTELLDQMLFLDDSATPKRIVRQDHDLLNVRIVPSTLPEGRIPTDEGVSKSPPSHQFTPREVLVSIPQPSKEMLVEKQLVSEVIQKSEAVFDLLQFIREQVANDVEDWIIRFNDLIFGKEIANGSTCTVYQGEYRGLPVGRLLVQPSHQEAQG